MQFIPAVIAPQMLLSGVIVPVASEPGWLQVVSNVLPLTYAVNGLRSVMLEGAGLGSGNVQPDVGVLAAFCVVTILAAAALTLLYSGYTRSSAYRRHDADVVSRDQGPMDFRS